jgi:hypothetical protein
LNSRSTSIKFIGNNLPASITSASRYVEDVALGFERQDNLVNSFVQSLPSVITMPFAPAIAGPAEGPVAEECGGAASNSIPLI